MRSRTPRISLALLGLFLILAFFAARQLVFDESLEKWVPEHFELVDAYASFLENFRSDALIIVAVVESGGVTPTLTAVDSLMGRLAALEHVTGAMRWPPPFLRSKITQSADVHSFFLSFTPPSHVNPHRPVLVQEITEILDSAGLEYHLAGTGVLHEAINAETKRASRQFLTLGLIVLVLLLAVLLRDPRAVLRTLGVSLGGLGSVFVSAWWFGIDFTLVASILPVLVLFYGTSVSLHVLHHAGDFRKVVQPVAMAVLTTCAGFAVFLLDEIPMLRDFGLLAISGLIGGFLWAALLYGPRPATDSNPLATFSYRRIARFWKVRYFLLGVAVMVILSPGVLRVRSEIDTLSVIPEDNRSLADHRYMEEHVGAHMPIEYQLPLGLVDRNEVQRWIDGVYAIDDVRAVMSYLAIPVWLDPRVFGYVSEAGDLGRVSFFVPIMSTTEGLALVSQIDDLAARIFTDPSVIPRATGYATLFVSVADVLAQSFRKGLLLAVLAVFSILLLFLRDLRLFLASILPNLFPIVAVLGIMGWFRIPLDMVTVPICCLVLGIIVDDSIHLLYWYKTTGTVSLAMEAAGPGIITTSLVMTAGFSVFLFAAAPPARNFGILTVTAMITALFGDVVMLPALLGWLKPAKSPAAETPP